MKRFLPVLLAFVFLAAFASAQESRSTFTGRVTDSTGAIVPHVRIEITNMDTGANTVTVSNSAGDYTVPFLVQGRYKVTAEMDGFKTYTHAGMTLQSEQTVTENIVLSVGSVDQAVTVFGDTPLVDLATSNTGQELTAEEVEDLPSNGRSPLGFAHFEYGAVSKGKHSESQTTPFGNSTADDFSLGGGNSSSNELLLNGVPNMQDTSRTAGFSPELDSVNAVHVDEFSANADLGDTSGGIVNISTKGGTNQFHGSASEYYNGSLPFEAQQYNFGSTARNTSTHFNQYGATIGGPILIPHILKGRDKLFFFYAYEGYKGNAPATTTTDVPTAAEREGDFSALLGVTASDQLYNPYSVASYTVSGTGADTNVIRNAVPNNCLTNTSTYCSGVSTAGLTINPVAAAYMAMMPAPNNNAAAADGENNYFVNDPTVNNYSSNAARIDYNVSTSNKLFVEAHRSKYTKVSANIFNNSLTGSFTGVVLEGGVLDDVHTFSSSLTVENRLGFARSNNWSGPDSLGQTPSSVGMPGYMDANSTVLALPYIAFTDSTSPPSLSAAPGTTTYFDDIQYFAGINKVWGKHNFKIGPDIRARKDSTVSPSDANGYFTFKQSTTSWVSQSPNVAADENKQAFGSAFALFDLGLPTSGQENIAPKYQYDNWYFAFYAQDDYKAMSNLTISIGVRVEHETPLVEAHNRMVAGWSPNLTNATTEPATVAYAASCAAATPSALCSFLAPSAFNANGGITYASANNRSDDSTANAYVSPRIGFSYSPKFSHGTLAIRGGAGIYVNPIGDTGGGASYGYTATSTMVNTATGDLYPLTTLSDPFPTVGSPNYTTTSNNPILQMSGSILGINTDLGSSLTYNMPVHVPYAEKWSLDVQKQFGKNWLVEAGYLGALQVHNSYTNQISNAPLLPYYSQTNAKNSASALAATTMMQTPVTNPFYGKMPSYISSAGGTVANTTSLNTSSASSVAAMLQAYPEYSAVYQALDPGVTQKFNAFLFRVTKRMSQGLEFNFNYEHSRQLGGMQLNAGGPLSEAETTSDFPDHATVTAIYKLPFGNGQLLFHDSSMWLDRAIGGWELTTIYQYLSGTPISWGNVNYSGNYKNFSNHPHPKPSQLKTPSFNIADFDTTSADQPSTYNYRTFPQYLLRNDPTKNFDFSLLKNFTVWQRVIVQPRVDAFNAFNRTQFGSASVSPTSSAFGEITSQQNTGRSLQGGVHILF